MTPGSLLITIGALLLLVLLSALVSAVETALFSLREHHLRAIRVRFGSRLELLDRIQKNPRQFLDGALFLGAVTNLAIAMLAFFLLTQLSRDWGFEMLTGAWLLFGTLLLLGDIVPKFLALARPGRVLSWTLGPFVGMATLVAPLSRSFSHVTEKLVSRLAPTRFRKPSIQFSVSELTTLLEMREEKGTLVKSESEMIQEVLRLGSKNAKDCMTPRVHTVCIESGASSRDIDEVVSSSQHWNLPVYRDTPDSIIGVLDVRAYLLNRPAPYENFIREPVFVPETMKALDLFKKYLREPKTLAVVLDEYGGFEGIVTHTDFVEEIMADAAPPGKGDREIIDLSGERFRVQGTARLDEIEEVLEIEFEEKDGLDTMGGLIFTHLGYVPKPQAEMKISGVHIRILRTSPTRIEEVLLSKISDGHQATTGQLGGATADNPRASADGQLGLTSGQENQSEPS